jgi:beta-glucosidase
VQVLGPNNIWKLSGRVNEILGSILPNFSSSDKEKLKNGLNFIGINHYSSYYVQDCIYSICEPGPGVTRTEGFYRQSSQKDGVPIGEPVSNFNIVTIITSNPCIRNH